MSFAALLSFALAAASPAQSQCAVEKSKFFALDPITFDQDPQRGWRSLASRGCFNAAANLIQDYSSTRAREIRTSAMGDLTALLSWHEGQLRAAIGEYHRARALFERSYKPKQADFDGWNLYVDATIAFISGNQSDLIKARDELRRVPRPKTVSPSQDWPPNLGPVERMVKCFGRRYAELKSDECE